MSVFGIIAAVGEFCSFIVNAIKLYRLSRTEGWYKTHQVLTEKIMGAKTDEERKLLVHMLAFGDTTGLQDSKSSSTN